VPRENVPPGNRHRSNYYYPLTPRFLDKPASKSKYWLPIKPSTDLALLLAWMNVIIKEELYDKEYVEKYTYGFDFLKNHVKKYTPEWAYTKQELTRRNNKNSSRNGRSAPAVIIHPGRHTVWYGDDTQRSRGIAILNALLGSYGRKGGFYFPAKEKTPEISAPRI